MANKQEKDNKAVESLVPGTTEMTNPTENTAVKTTEAEPEKKGLWSKVKGLSTPMKVGLGVVGGAILTGIGIGVKFLVDAFMNQSGDDDSSDDSAGDSESPEDE